MPVYLTRWPDGSCTLSQAKNRTALMEVLDHEGSPNGVRITRVLNSWSITVEPPAQEMGMMSFEIRLAECDAGAALGAVFEEFYPNLKTLTDDHLAIEDFPAKEWDAALAKDLALGLGEPKTKGSFRGSTPQYGVPFFTGPVEVL